MLIYIFAEHYPNPYKPQFDTEFAFLVRQGHDIHIYVGGEFASIMHPRVRQYSLDKKTSQLPTTLRTLPRYIPLLILRTIGSPRKSFQRARAIYNQNDSLKRNLTRIAKVLLLPICSPDLCYIHNIATADWIDFLHLIYPDSRLVMYFHGGEVGGVKRISRDAELFKHMHTVFSNTNFSKNQAISRGCPPERAVVMPVGFDLEDYPIEKAKSYRIDGTLRLISIGRLSEEKGLVFAIDAISKLIEEGNKQIHYTIVGRGLQDNYLRDYVINNNLTQHVEFVGEQDKAGVVRYLERSDALILPSLISDTWAETQAAVVQEAMFMRLLVIGTKAGGVPESTADILHQFSVTVGDADAIANMIRKILMLSESDISRMGNEARNFAINKFDIEKIGPRMLNYAMGHESEIEG